MNFIDIELPSNRKFGFFFTALFILTGIYLFNMASIGLAYFFFGLAGILFVVTLFKEESLLPLNKLWMRFGLLLGMIVGPIVLAIIFFTLFTPISLLMKIFGRDELRLKLSNRTSHWKNRSNEYIQEDSFKNQF